MDFYRLTELLQEKLLLELPPVALAFADEPPPGVTVMGKESPSFCTFWRWGEQSVFYARADQHLGCLIGGMVSGFPMTEEQLGEVQGLLEEMCHDESVPLDNVEDVPRVSKQSKGILYGPLWQFPSDPDLVIFWASMFQAAILQDVTQPLVWKGNPQGAYFGRPACGVLAVAMNTQQNSYSLGCVGMRAYTEIPGELGLIAIPGSRLQALMDALPGIDDPKARIQAYQDKVRAAQEAQAQQNR